MSRRERALGLCTVWFATAIASAQQQPIHVDLGVPAPMMPPPPPPLPGAGPPDNAFCGAAGVPGVWHNVSSMMPVGCMGTCYALGGAVTLTRSSNAGTIPSPPPPPPACAATGDFGKLLCDAQDLTLADPMFGTVTYTFSGLLPGWYRVYTYAIHPQNGTAITSVSITNSTSTDPQPVGGPLPMADFVVDTTHAEHDVIVPMLGPMAGSLEIVAQAGPTGGAVSGFQIVPRRIYVDAAASGDNNGTNWLHAYTDLQLALAEAATVPVQVWVADGVYAPAQPGGDRAVSFALSGNVAIYGGFDGATASAFPCGETQLAQRDPNPLTNMTILSGDLNGDDGPDFANNGENSYHVVRSVGAGPGARLDGFTITGGNANGPPESGDDGGGGFRQDGGSPMIRNCRFESNSCAGNGGGVFCNSGVLNLAACTISGNSADGSAGGMQLAGAVGVFDEVTKAANAAPSASAGFVGIATLDLPGKLVVASGVLEAHDAEVDAAGGPGHIELGPTAELAIGGLIPNAESTVLRANVLGNGRIFVEAGEVLVLEDGTLIDLSGADVPGMCMEVPTPQEPPALGTLTLHGNLLVPNGTVQFCNIEVMNEASSVTCGNAVGGRVIAPNALAQVVCNVVRAYGDRYYITSPFMAAPLLNDNHVTLIVTPDQSSDEQGELLEVRDFDHDVGPDPMNPQHPCPEQEPCLVQLPTDPESEGFTGPWALQRLELQPGARLNLTNRANDPSPEEENMCLPPPAPPCPPQKDVLYVRDLVLGAGAVLNSSLHRMYYQNLLDENGDALVPVAPNDPTPTEFTNGAQIVSVPLLGFALEVIELDDACEFTVRVRTGISAGSSVSLVDGEPVSPGVGGVMDMHCGTGAEVFAGATGAFAPVLEDEVTVAFDYLFADDSAADAELVVYLRDTPGTAPLTCTMSCCDQNACEVARVTPPNPGRAGSIGSTQFARFYGVFPSGLLDFSGGTYVELRLLGAGAHVWIDKWDPMIECLACADLNGNAGVELADYLVVLSEYGLNLETPPSGNHYCIDAPFGGDYYVDLGDVLAWDALINQNNTDPPPPNACSLNVVGGDQSGTGSSFPGNALIITGKPAAAAQGDRLYALSTAGQAVAPPRPPASAVGPAGLQVGNGRVIANGTGELYQLHLAQGLIRLSDAASVLRPGLDDFGGQTVQAGVLPIEGGSSGWPVVDAAFHPADNSILYVAPVLVTPAAGGYCDSFRAAARLALGVDGAFTVTQLYEPPAGSDTSACFAIPEEDYRNLRELELFTVSGDIKIVVASAQAINANDWLLVYDDDASAPSQVLGLHDLSLPVEAPSALMADDGKLYMTSAINASTDGTTRLFRFTLGDTIAFDAALNIAAPACQDFGFGLGCTAYITAIAAQPDGTLTVVGASSPRIPQDLSVSYAPLFGSTAPLFTTPMLATISATSDLWSSTDPGTVTAEPLCVSGLGLPISMVYNSVGAPGAPGDANASGHADLRDFAELQSCFTGEGSFTLTPECAFFSGDCDSDVDAGDHAAFVGVMTGP